MTESQQLTIDNFLTVPVPQYGDYLFHGFELGEDILVNYLRRTSPRNQVDQSILTNLAEHHLNRSGSLRTRQLPNSWTITSNFNIVDYDNKIIYLAVVLSSNRINEIRSGKHHSCLDELEVIKFVHDQPNWSYQLIMFDKLHSPYRVMKTDPINFFEPTLSDMDTIETKLLVRTNKLSKHLDSRKSPPTCKDIRWHRRGGTNRPMSCLFYCDYASSCTKQPDTSRAKLKSLIF
ncbi:MAG: hypothetical protein ACTSVR_04435 [Candidatus Thorarchaeota archaeon]